MNVKSLTLFVLLCFLMSHCSKELGTGGEGAFSIYFLADSTLTVPNVLERNLNVLELADQPWLSDEDITMYDFSTHCIYLKKTKQDLLDIFKTPHYLLSISDKPFVVCAGGQNCYLGSIHSGASATAPITPYIDELSIHYFPADILYLAKAWPEDDHDTRNNPVVKEELIGLRLYHAGLEVILKDIRLIQNSDTSTIQYTFQIINRDDDNLYVLDPEQMGRFFHYFTNGPDIWGNEGYFYSQFKTDTTPEEDWDSGWYTLIPSGRSIERTVQLKGYPKFPAGGYTCHFRYSCPPVQDKSQRITASGRYWMGEIQTESIGWNVQ